ncbi:MAG TPA: response regulator transcription factor [Phycisphaerales bacterium]|nr:response regulator transcription factor [Phycisphaerales bacterium]
MDDNPDVRRAIEPVLARWGWTLVGALESADDLVRSVVAERPDVLLLDIDMPGRSAVHAIQELRYRGSATKVLVYSGISEEQTIRDCMDAGAMGYTLKLDGLDALRDGLHAVHAGRSYLSPSISGGQGGG